MKKLFLENYIMAFWGVVIVIVFFICTGNNANSQNLLREECHSDNVSVLPTKMNKQVKVVNVSRDTEECEAILKQCYKDGWHVVTMAGFNEYYYTIILEK